MHILPREKHFSFVLRVPLSPFRACSLTTTALVNFQLPDSLSVPSSLRSLRAASFVRRFDLKFSVCFQTRDSSDALITSERAHLFSTPGDTASADREQ